LVVIGLAQIILEPAQLFAGLLLPDPSKLLPAAGQPRRVSTATVLVGIGLAEIILEPAQFASLLLPDLSKLLPVAGRPGEFELQLLGSGSGSPK
jgi:hypothetical protein